VERLVESQSGSNIEEHNILVADKKYMKEEVVETRPIGADNSLGLLFGADGMVLTN
jgi:hypothetical protein